MLWVDGDQRVREELDTGVVRFGETLEDASNWPLLDPDWLIDDPGLTAIGECQVGGREGIVVKADAPAGLLLHGADRCVGVVDRERGVVLRAEAWLGEHLLMVEELVEVVFDEQLDESLFGVTEVRGED
ncbi:MAG: hypothetical protein WBB76_00285 [Gaiellaceae bacterium]